MVFEDKETMRSTGVPVSVAALNERLAGNAPEPTRWVPGVDEAAKR